MKNDRTLTKAKLEELASTVGAGILGFGLGALLANFIQQYKKDHINFISQIKASEISWINLLYWFCWIIIIGLAIYVLVKLL